MEKVLQRRTHVLLRSIQDHAKCLRVENSIFCAVPRSSKMLLFCVLLCENCSEWRLAWPVMDALHAALAHIWFTRAEERLGGDCRPDRLCSATASAVIAAARGLPALGAEEETPDMLLHRIAPWLHMTLFLFQRARWLTIKDKILQRAIQDD